MAITGRLSSVEILASGSSEWKEGPTLPEPLGGHQMVEWDNTLVVLGGCTGSSISSKCYFLQYQNGIFFWSEMDARMIKARYRFVAMTVPDR